MEKEICLLFPCSWGSLRRGGPPPCLRGTPQNQSLPGMVPWALGLGAMPCEQMAVIAGNPETLQESCVWVFTAAWAHREHQDGRLSGAWSVILLKMKRSPFSSQREPHPTPAPSTQHPGPAQCHTQGKQCLASKGTASMCLHLPPLYLSAPHIHTKTKEQDPGPPSHFPPKPISSCLVCVTGQVPVSITSLSSPGTHSSQYCDRKPCPHRL